MTFEEILKSMEDLKDSLNDAGRRHLDGLISALKVLFDNKSTIPKPVTQKEEPKKEPVKITRIIVSKSKKR